MGMYTSLTGPSKSYMDSRISPSEVQKYYELARRMGSSEEEARALSRNPDVFRFLDAKENRMQQAGEPIAPAPKRPGPGNLLEAIKDLPKNLMSRKMLYSLGLSDQSAPPAPQPDVPNVAAVTAPAPNTPDLLNNPPEYDMMGQRKGWEPPVKPSGPTPSLGPMPGPQTPPQTDQWDRIAELAPDDNGERNRMIMAVMEGLTRAGAEASNVPGLLELLAGKGRGPTDQTNANMLRQLRGESAKTDEAKTAWATSATRKSAEDMYKRKFDTREDLIEYQNMKKGEADIKAQEGLTESRKFASQLKNEEAEYTKQVEEQRRQLLASGDLSGLDKDSQKKLDELRTNLNKEEAKLIESVRIADKGLKSVDELSDNDMAYMAAGVMVARASGEVGNLSKTEVQVYNKHPHAEGQLEAFADWARGEISQGRRDTVIEILRHHRDEGIKRLRKRVTDETDAFRTFNKEANPEAVMKFMGLGMPEEVQGEAKAEMDWYFVAKDTPDGKYKVGQKVQLTPEEAEQARAAQYIE